MSVVSAASVWQAGKSDQLSPEYMSPAEAALVALLSEYAGVPFLVERPNRASTLRTIYIRESSSMDTRSADGHDSEDDDHSEEEPAQVSLSKCRRGAMAAAGRGKRTRTTRRRASARVLDEATAEDESSDEAPQAELSDQRKQKQARKSKSSSVAEQHRLSVLGGVATSAATAGQLVGAGAGAGAQLTGEHLRTLFAPCGPVVQVHRVDRSALGEYTRM
jgi:hypothetical protein